MVPLGEVLRLAPDPYPVRADQEYPNFGMYSFGRGLFRKQPISGNATSARTLFRVRKGQFIYSRLFAFEGAYGSVAEEFDGCFVSNEYPTFDCDPSRIDGNYLRTFFHRPTVWEETAKLSTGMGDRRRRVQPERFLLYRIPLPPLNEQRRIVARIEALAGRITEAKRQTNECDDALDATLKAAFRRLADTAGLRPLGEVAPLTRRPAIVISTQKYPGVSVRSFGRGTFHNPAVSGSEMTWEKPHLVKAGDILISNIKAWEGAIAVAGCDDDGRYGSHRYLTFVPESGVIAARFLCFFLLTDEGLSQVGEVSPGSADRNRTKSTRGLQRIPIPVPKYEQQVWFGELFDKVNSLKAHHAIRTAELDALLLAVLDRAFRGEL